MGMTIEDIIQGLRETYVICRSVYAYDRKKYIDGAIDRLNKYQMMKADYKNRLKADMVAILVELQLEIDELPNHELQSSDWKQGFTHGLADVQEKVIQKKINELKEKDNGK